MKKVQTIPDAICHAKERRSVGVILIHFLEYETLDKTLESISNVKSVYVEKEIKQMKHNSQDTFKEKSEYKSISLGNKLGLCNFK